MSPRRSARFLLLTLAVLLLPSLLQRSRKQQAEPVTEESATSEDAAKRVAQLMECGMSRKDAIKQTAQELKLPKNVVYDAALEN